MVVVERKIKEGWKGGRWFISFITSLKLHVIILFSGTNGWVWLGINVRWWVFVGRSVGWALVDGKKCVLWKEFGIYLVFHPRMPSITFTISAFRRVFFCLLGAGRRMKNESLLLYFQFFSQMSVCRYVVLCSSPLAAGRLLTLGRNVRVRGVCLMGMCSLRFMF